MEANVLTTIEELNSATARLLETAAKVEANTWQQRAEWQKNHCKWGEEGTCCKICTMGPCRITAKQPRGICGCDAHGIVGRNFLRFTAGGAATHSDHGREICRTLGCTKEGGDYQVKDPEKLIAIAKEWDIPTEGRDIYDIAHEVSEVGLMDYGKPHGTLRFLKRATAERQKVWADNELAPRAIDREVSCAMHMTHMGCSSKPEALLKQCIRSGLSDGWGGSMMGTEFSDVMFGTPTPIDTTANLGVMDVEQVNIVVHGHDPSLSEMIVLYSKDPEMLDAAKAVGAKGICISGVCCTSNEVTMRHGIPMAGNFLQQENVVLTGACEAIVVDVQCIFPALGPLSKCFHTKFITTSKIAQMPDSDFIHFEPETAGENAKKIIRMAIDNFKNRKPELVHIPDMKQSARVGYGVEAIEKRLDTVTNSFLNEIGTFKPLVECLESGVLRGAVAMVGCNNPKIRSDTKHIALMKKFLENDIILVLSGCSAQAAAKVGLMSRAAAEHCGRGLRRVCDLADIPPTLHMGSCVDISRMMILATRVANDWGISIPELPLLGCAPEWMSEKAVSIGNYVVGTGIDTYLGVSFQTKGSDQVWNHLCGEDGLYQKTLGARFYVYDDDSDDALEKMADDMIAHIERKRDAIGI